MKKRSKYIDALFRKGLKEERANISFDNNDWTALEQRLDRHNRRRRIFIWFRTLTGIAVIAGLAFILWPPPDQNAVNQKMVRENKPQTDQPQASQLQAEKPKADQPQASQSHAEQPKAGRPRAQQPQVAPPKTNQPQANQLRAEPPKVGRPRANQSPADRPRTDPPRADQPHTGQLQRFSRTSPPTTAPRSDGQKSSSGADRTPATGDTANRRLSGQFPGPEATPSVDPASPRAPGRLNTLDGEGIIRPYPLPPGKENAPGTIAEKPGYSGRDFYYGLFAGPDLSSIKGQGVKHPGYTTGILVGYRLGRKWALETGVQWTQKNYFTEGKYFNKYNAGIASSSELLSLDGNCRMWVFPLAARYDFLPGTKQSFFATAGLSSYLMKKESYDYMAANGGSTYNGHRSYNNSGNHLFSHIQLSAGYSRSLSGKWSLRLEPYFQLPIKQVGVGKIPITSAGLYAGFVLDGKR